MKLTKEQEQILLQLIEERKIVDNAIPPTPTDEKPATRGVTLYKSQYARFAGFCKAHNLNQADGLFKALELFMNTYK